MSEIRIDSYVTRPHYWAHIKPIWEALPGILRGTAYDPRTKMSAYGLAPYVLCAGYDDAVFIQHLGRKVIYVEHGAGQAYNGIEAGNYSGGRGLDEVALFICPSETVAGRWRHRYPWIPAAAIGCPKMDAYHGVQAVEKSIAITFHWDCRICPESRSAFEHYRDDLPALVKLCGDLCVPLVAHAHPRWDDPQSGGSPGEMCRFWLDLGVEYTPFESDVFLKSSLLISDNTSLMYEFASLDKPVIALNAPWYRLDVHHGLRFWDHVPGPMVWTPDELVQVTEEYIEWVNDYRDCKPTKDLVPYVYAAIDGHASQRAVEAIREVVHV